MTNPPRRETAKIYRFPNRMRIVATEMMRTERPVLPRHYAICDASSGWYHETAIQDELRDRKP